MMVNEDLLRERAAEIRWFHTMSLGSGVVTKGYYDPAEVLPRLHLPARLDGLRVLDVGAWDGFFSFEAERRGAQVLATDHFCWSGPGLGTKAGFDLAHDAFSSQVEALDIDPFQLCPEAVGGTFDVVLLLGVLYHVKDPLGLLERVRSVTRNLLILETQCGMLLTRSPAAAFFPGSELNADGTNWWAPNIPAAVGLLGAAGFSSVEVKYRTTLAYRTARWARHLLDEDRSGLWEALNSDRVVLHARA
jgi:tRNA (mo5U34)-methyltransferase